MLMSVQKKVLTEKYTNNLNYLNNKKLNINIDDLNRRLNETKKTEVIRNYKIIALALSVFAAIIFVSFQA
jgi:hypothetical protein